MGEAKEIRRISEYEHNHHHHHPSIQINGYPRDLLQRFRAGSHFTAELGGTKKKSEEEEEEEEEDEEEEEELNLGLSLGSLFGMKGPSENNRLVRSSSIAGLTSLFREEDVSLIRTCSLPVEPEEDRRKRKEMQSLRRLEAKRKRSEKQRNCRVKEKAAAASLDEEDKRPVVAAAAGGGGGGGEGGVIVKNKGFKQKVETTGIQQQYMVSNGFSFRPPNWAPPSSQVTAAARRIDPGSQGSSSSGTSEIEGRHVHQGPSSCAEARSPKSVQSLPEQSEQKPVVAPTTMPPNTEKSSMSTGFEVENPSNKPKVDDNGSREMGMKMMEEEKMPCCWTTGSGPNGKRIEGLLYNYRKGEEVRIVCVCHGSFLTPAEFVKHAGGGGGDVENPLRHITVNLSSSSSF